MQEKRHFIIDFDSTFSKVEALDILGEIALKEHNEKEISIRKIKEITDKGMEGKITFRESLESRIKILKGNKSHLPELIRILKTKVSASFKRNKEFLIEYSDQFYILSNGFKDFIVPVVADYGIAAENVFANDFIYDAEGNIVDFDRTNVLSSNNGKPTQIERLKLEGEVYVLGDGFTDYEIKKAGFAKKFYAFTENIRREKILALADDEAKSFDEFLYAVDMKRALSYPKSKIKVLLLENIHAQGIDKLKEEGYQVEVYPAGMSEDELCEAIQDVSIIGIRSKTQITRKVLEKAKRLMSVGAFCIGTNQIDLIACQEQGVAVFNAPYSNTRSVVELAIGEIILLMRNLPDRLNEMHNGVWTKSAKNSNEIRGKSLGIVGYGSIGSQLSVIAETMGMRVFYYDLEEKLALGNATRCDSLEELLELSEVVSLHVDGRPENTHIFNEDIFSKMKKGTILINLSRGKVVEMTALKKYIENGTIRGVGVDVFPEEPMSNQDEFRSELRGLPNIIMTPHIGGSTEEAQRNIANFVPNRIMDYMNSGSTSGSVNFPNLVLPSLQNAHRFIHVHHNEPGVLAEINQVLAEHSINIVGQYLKTNDLIGYVITDINKNYDDSVISTLKKIKSTIRFRVLY
ncbi:MAG: phosphoglycerate dehydrogenase [Cyclobacteriaceae bacterium]